MTSVEITTTAGMPTGLLGRMDRWAVVLGGGYPPAVERVPQDLNIYRARAATLFIPTIQAMLVGASLGVLLTGGNNKAAPVGALALGFVVLAVDFAVLQAKGVLWPRALLAIVIAVVLSFAAMPQLFSQQVLDWKRSQLADDVVAQAKKEKQTAEAKIETLRNLNANGLARLNPDITRLKANQISANQALVSANLALETISKAPIPALNCNLRSRGSRKECYQAAADAAARPAQAQTAVDTAQQKADAAGKAYASAISDTRNAGFAPLMIAVANADERIANPTAFPDGQLDPAHYGAAARIVDALHALNPLFHLGLFALMLSLDLMVVVMKKTTSPVSETLTDNDSKMIELASTRVLTAQRHQDALQGQEDASKVAATRERLEIELKYELQASNAEHAAAARARTVIAEATADDKIQRHRDELASNSAVPTAPPAPSAKTGTRPSEVSRTDTPAPSPTPDLRSNPGDTITFDNGATALVLARDFRSGGEATLHLAKLNGLDVLIKEPRRLDEYSEEEWLDILAGPVRRELVLYEWLKSTSGVNVLGTNFDDGLIALTYHPQGALDEFLGIDLESPEIKYTLTLAELLVIVYTVAKIDFQLWEVGQTRLDAHAGNYVVCGKPGSGRLSPVDYPLNPSDAPGTLKAIDHGLTTSINEPIAFPSDQWAPLIPPDVPRDRLVHPNPLWDVYQLGCLTRTLLTNGGWDEFDPQEFAGTGFEPLAMAADTWMAHDADDRVPVEHSTPALKLHLEDQIRDLMKHATDNGHMGAVAMQEGIPNRNFGGKPLEYSRISLQGGVL